MADPLRVVIIGAGFGGLAAAKRLEKQPVDVTVIDRHNYHTFQPLLYQVATAGLNPADIAYPVRGLFQRRPRVNFRQGEVTGVDTAARLVHLKHEDPLPFDRLIVAGGSTTEFFGVTGAADLAFPLYNLTDSLGLRNHVLSVYEAADAIDGLVDQGVLTFVVVGGGPTGVEVAGALAELIDQVLTKDFHDLDVSRSRVVLVEQGDVLLAPFSPKSQQYAQLTLEKRGVSVRLGTAVESIAADHVMLSGGERLPTRTVVWAAGVRAGAVAGEGGWQQGKGGRITVAPDLSIPGIPEVFAVGDIADIDDGTGGRLPQLAQVAIQGGRFAADQIRNDLAGQPRGTFHYRDKGIMATIGRRAAVAELPGGARLTGFIAWLSWLFLHLIYLLGARNRVSVIVNWCWNYLTWDRGPRLILNPEELPQSPRRPPDAVRG